MTWATIFLIRSSNLHHSCKSLCGSAVRVVDPLGGVSTRTFDAMNRCTSETTPLGVTSYASYDGAGRFVRNVDADGRLFVHTSVRPCGAACLLVNLIHCCCERDYKRVAFSPGVFTRAEGHSVA